MRLPIIILSLISNFVLGQNKATIEQDIVKYEVKDEFNRFDNIPYENKRFKNFEIKPISESEIEIVNRYSSGFTGITINIRLDKELNIIQATYNYWTDVAQFDAPKFIVEEINLKLNQNPFEKRNRLRGQYTMQIQKVSSEGKLIKTIEFKGKFKNFNGIDRESADYQWALEQKNIFAGITNENGIYLRPDKMPSLKSNPKVLVKEIKKLKGYKPDFLRVKMIINEKGEIEKESFRFFGDSEYLNVELKNKIKGLIVKSIEWYPGCVNGKAVKSQIPLVMNLNKH